MLAVRFHVKKIISYLLCIQVVTGKSDKDRRSVKMLRLVSDYNNIWEVLIKIMQRSGIMVVTVSHTNGQQSVFPFY